MIAAQYGTPLEPLLKSNPDIDEETILEVGQKIKVPSNGVKVVKNQTTSMPKWWYEEQEGAQGEMDQEPKTSLEYAPPVQELPEYPYAYYPATYPNAPASASSNYGYYPALPANPSRSNYDPYGAYVHIPAQPMTYSYSPFPSPPYERAMMILASNRIPIPPRMVNVNGVKSVKLPSSFFHLDEWNEDWEAVEQEEQQD